MRNVRFSEQVYKLLRKVPKGKVTTYGEIARAMGVRAYRAVGQALRCNPNPIVVPCHRVVRSNGELGGFALGPKKKKSLLISEGVAIEAFQVKDLARHLYSFKSQVSPKTKAKK